MNRATKAICTSCNRERHAHQIEETGACELCALSTCDATQVGTEFDLDVATALLWATPTAQRAPAVANDVTAPMRAVARAQ